MTDVKDIKGQAFTFGNLTKEDYPELEGKIIKYDDGVDVIDVIVVGCNTALGVTLVNATDKDDYFVCLTGKSAPGGCNCNNYEEYVDLFNVVVAGIKEGVLLVEDLKAVDQSSNVGPGGPNAGMCAYGQ